MSNIYLKIAINKKLRTQNLDLAQFSDSSEVAPTHADNIEFSNFLLQLKNQRSGSKTVRGFSIILILKVIRTF